MLLSPLELFELAAAAGGCAVGAWAACQRLYVPVPPNRALILFGRRALRQARAPESGAALLEARAPRVVVGGGVVLAPWNKAFAYLSLAPIDVEATVRAVHGVEGGSAVGWEVTLAVQAKIPTEPAALRAAAENLFGLSAPEVALVVRRAVEGSVPLVLSRLGPDEAEPDWDRLASEIQATVAPELVPSGLVVRSVAVLELRRIAPGPSPPPRGDARARDGKGSGTRTAAEELDGRLARIERGLEAMAVRVERWGRDAPARLARPLPQLPRELGPGPAPLYDSMEEGPPPRKAPALALGRAGGEPPTSSDEETSR